MMPIHYNIKQKKISDVKVIGINRKSMSINLTRSALIRVNVNHNV
jgi:hypothetical protein